MISSCLSLSRAHASTVWSKWCSRLSGTCSWREATESRAPYCLRLADQDPQYPDKQQPIELDCVSGLMEVFCVLFCVFDPVLNYTKVKSVMEMTREASMQFPTENLRGLREILPRVSAHSHWTCLRPCRLSGYFSYSSWPRCRTLRGATSRCSSSTRSFASIKPNLPSRLAQAAPHVLSLTMIARCVSFRSIGVYVLNATGSRACVPHESVRVRAFADVVALDGAHTRDG
jgi:hypothetical protein